MDILPHQAMFFYQKHKLINYVNGQNPQLTALIHSFHFMFKVGLLCYYAFNGTEYYIITLLGVLTLRVT